jgi:hypothetical protein
MIGDQVSHRRITQAGPGAMVPTVRRTNSGFRFAGVAHEQIRKLLAPLDDPLPKKDVEQ